MDFTMSDKQAYWRSRVVDFMNEHVYPAVPTWEQQMHAFGANRWQVPAVLEPLKAKAKAAGLWNLFLPKDSLPGPGLHYNPYFANLNLAMSPPLAADDQVAYADGTKATVDQMAQDVAAFLTWTAEPKLENRRAAGLATIIFLLIATGLAYMSYQNIWADKKKAA